MKYRENKVNTYPIKDRERERERKKEGKREDKTGTFSQNSGF